MYPKYNNKGWVNPSNISFEPHIISLTSYKSPSGSNTVVSIIGTNFLSYSIIRFGTFMPTVYFVTSKLLSFYIPTTLNSGIFPVTVSNGSLCSNIVNYTIDNASGYWMLNSRGYITNTNKHGLDISWLSRGTPVTIDSTIYVEGNPYLIPNNVTWIICNVSFNHVYIELPVGPDFTGRELTFKTIESNHNIINKKSIIQSIDSNTCTNIILDSQIYSWTTLVFDGSNWITMKTA